MKKQMSFVLAVIIALTILAGCDSSSKQTNSTVDTSGSTAAPETSSPETISDQGIETNEGVFTVDITFPAWMYEGEDLSTFDTDAYVKANNYIAATVNEDGSITVTMTKSRHQELIEEMSASLDTTFSEFVGGEDTPYVKEITHNDDFSSIVIKVVRAEYEKAFDVTPLSVGISAMFFQVFLDTEYHVKVTVVDVETGDEVTSVTYPDAFEE